MEACCLTSQVCYTSFKNQKESLSLNLCVSWESVHTNRNDDSKVQSSNKQLLVSVVLVVLTQSEQLWVDRCYKQHRHFAIRHAISTGIFACYFSFALNSAQFLENGVLICCYLVISVTRNNEKIHYRSPGSAGLWVFSHRSVYATDLAFLLVK